jgi:hypothetical protein
MPLKGQKNELKMAFPLKGQFLSKRTAKFAIFGVFLNEIRYI